MIKQGSTAASPQSSSQRWTDVSNTYPTPTLTWLADVNESVLVIAPAALAAPHHSRRILSFHRFWERLFLREIVCDYIADESFEDAVGRLVTAIIECDFSLFFTDFFPSFCHFFHHFCHFFSSRFPSLSLRRPAGLVVSFNGSILIFYGRILVTCWKMLIL